MITKLICPDCRYENEAERIYCHHCGARLDRTGIIRERVDEESSKEQTRQHLKNMFDPDRDRNKRIALKFGKVLLGALVLGAVIVMLLPPDLPPAPKNGGLAPLINMDMVSALSRPQPTSLTYSEEQVNSYMASAVRRKDGPAQEGFFPLRRIFVQFDEGQCWIHAQRQLFKVSIFAGSDYRVKIQDGKIQATSSAGYIGRMPIHPALMKYADALLGKAWDTLARERSSVARMSEIQFHPQSVTLVVAR